MKYGALCFNMKIRGRIKTRLLSLGLTEEELEEKKVIKFTKVYPPDEISQILSRNREELFTDIRGISGSNSKGLRKTLLSELACDNYIEANLKREKLVLKYSSLNSRVITLDKIESNHKVYAFKLQENVLEDNKFAEANPNYQQGNPLIYVGMTGKSISERFKEHTDPNCSTYNKGSKIMKKYGVKEFAEADSSILLGHQCIGRENLTYGEALQNEKLYGEWLRSQGYAVWWN